MKTTFFKIRPWLGLLAITGVLFLWSQTFTHYSVIPLELLLPGLALLALLSSFVSRVAWVWWLLGLVTIFWSLAPSRALMGGLWEAWYLLAFAAGAAMLTTPSPSSGDWKSYLTSPKAWFWGIQWWLLLDNVQTALALNASSMAFLASGSHHYTMGAQALLLVGVCLSGLRERDARGWLAWLGLAIALYAALMSGSRAVQLPLVLMLGFAAWRLLRERAHLGLLAARVMLLAVTLFGADMILAGNPVAFALGRVNAAASASDFRGEGSAGSRLLMWDQTMRAAIQYPFGTGNAGFRDVLPAFQRYPSISFNSAHNYYLETLMTGGWWRLGVLLFWLLPTLWRGWRSKDWGLSLGTAGVWATLTFDVTGYMPSVMTLAFAALGATSGSSGTHVQTRASRLELGLRWGALAIAIGVAAWWFAPCADPVQCALERHRGQREEVTALAGALEADRREVLLGRAKTLNPRSLWVDNLALEATETPLERLVVLRRIVDMYPVASPGYYLERARIAASMNLKTESIKTLEQGLRVFPVGSVSAGVPLRGVDPLEVWSREAPALLETLKRP